MGRRSRGPWEYNHEMPQLVHIQNKYATSHGYILGIHMSEHTLLNNVMIMRSNMK